MKNLYYLILFLFGIVNAQIVNIPDAEFKDRLLTGGGIDENLEYIDIDANNDGEIQYSEAQMVYMLNVGADQISDMTGIEAFTNLIDLQCYENNINTLDLTALVNLKSLSCRDNRLSSLNVSGLVNLESLSCSNNYLSSLNLEGLENLEYLSCNNNLLQSLNLSDSPNLKSLGANDNELTSLQIDGLLNLEYLGVSDSNLQSLNLSSFNQLKRVYCGNNNLSYLNVSGLSLLETLDISGNPSLGGNIQFQNLPNLAYFYVQNIGATHLDVSHLGSLKTLYCGYNEGFVSLNVNGLTELDNLYIRKNNLTELDLSTNTKLRKLNCIDSFSLRDLDLSNNYYLDELDISEFSHRSELTYLNIKNGSNFLLVEDIFLKPDNCYICVDENDGYYSYEGTFTTTYCSYDPGGTNNIITGTLRFDNDNDGSCEAESNHISSYIKLNISDGIDQGHTFANSSGTYNFYTQDGTYTITPEINENPELFNINPESADITFIQVDGSVQTQNFCITPNGNHPDVEIMVFPLEPARPGFESSYKIVYRNKGNQTVSGDINFEYDDSRMDLILSNPIADSQSTGSLTYNFSGLNPFETKEIILSFEINAPTDTPAVNIGDILPFTTQINIPDDENPGDNTYDFNQEVVGSFDPNDITCIEGKSVDAAMIGEELHYKIRFENTGNYPAERVVVAMPINTEEYDVSSFQLLNTSHNVHARVVNNTAEFFFEQIDLAPNEEGDILFSIKSLDSLEVGDSVMSYADIYFDYNYPITTNEEITTYEILGTEEVGTNVSLNLYPNPVKDSYTLKSDAKIKTIELYDSSGRLLKVSMVNDFETKQDMSAQPKGIYILKVYTEKGVNAQKIVKQ